MLIIDDKYLIIHMYKCGGSSFCGGLINLIADDSRVDFYGYTQAGQARSVQSWKQRGLWKHSTAAEAKAALGPRYDKLVRYFVSARPYWERVGSFYYYCKRHNDRDPAKYPFVARMSFSDYLRSPHVLKAKINDYVCDGDGSIIVDRIVPYENLGGAYAELADKLGYKDAVIPQINKNPDEVNYRSCYTSGDLKYLDGLFASEKEFLGRNPPR